MDVAAGRAIGGVDVGVRVNPDQSYILVLPAIEFGDTGHRARRHQVVSAQHQRNHAGFERLDHQLGVLGAGSGNFFRYLADGSPAFFCSAMATEMFPRILHHVPQFFQPRLQAGHAYRRGSHVHAPARLSQVERDANHPDFPGHDVRRGCGWRRHSFRFTAEVAENAESGNSFTTLLSPSLSTRT